MNKSEVALYERLQYERENRLENLRDEVAILREIYVQLAKSDKPELASYVDHKINELKGGDGGMNNSDMPAYPHVDADGHAGLLGDGLSKREHYAGLAMQSIIANPQYFSALQDQAVELDILGHDCEIGKLVAELSWHYADKLLAQQEKTK